MNLIKYIMKHNMNEYGALIDWWLTEGKFENWGKNQVTSFTKKIHTMKGFSKKRDLHYDSAKNLKFPKKVSRFPQVWIGNGYSEGRDWVRHVRNGIAHGNANVRTIKGEPILEMLDYQSDGTTQTAYIFMPIYYLILIQKAYKDVCKEK